MNRLMVATDLTDKSLTAVRRAVLIANRLDADLYVMHIVDGEFPLTIGESERLDAEIAMQAQLDAIPEASNISTSIMAFFGEPATDIAEFARDYRIDLIVMGQHRDRGISEVFRGSTIDRLASAAKVSILVAARDAKSAYCRAVVGIDFSTCAAKATDLAIRLVGPANVKPVHAYFPRTTNPSTRAGPQADKAARDIAATQDYLRQEIKTWRTLNPLPDLKQDIELHQGEPADVLAKVAFDTSADLICVGAHGKSWLATQFMGSTALELLSRSKCEAPQYSNIDLLIVPL